MLKGRPVELVSLHSRETVEIAIDPEVCTLVLFYHDLDSLGTVEWPGKTQFVGVFTGEEPPADLKDGYWTGPKALNSPLCEEFAVTASRLWVCLYQSRTVFTGAGLPSNLPAWLDSLYSSPPLAPTPPPLTSVSLWRIDGTGPVDVRFEPENRVVVIFTEDLFILREFATKMEVETETEDLQGYAIYTGVDLVGVSEESDAVFWYWAGPDGLNSPVCLLFGVTVTPDLRCLTHNREAFKSTNMPESISSLFPPIAASHPPSDADTESKKPENPSEVSQGAESIEENDRETATRETRPPPASLTLATAPNIVVFAGNDPAEIGISLDSNDFILFYIAKNSEFDAETVIKIRDETAGVPNFLFFPVSASDVCPTETDLYWAGQGGGQSGLCQVLQVETTPMFVLLQNREVKYLNSALSFPLYSNFDFLQRPKSAEKQINPEDFLPSTISIAVFDPKTQEMTRIPIDDQQLTLILYFEDWSQVPIFTENMSEWEDAVRPLAVYVAEHPPTQPDLAPWVYWSGPDSFSSPSCELLSSASVPMFLGLWGGRVVWAEAEFPDNIGRLLGEKESMDEVESQLRTKELGKEAEQKRYFEDVEMYRKRIAELEGELNDVRRDNQLLRASTDTLKARLSIPTRDISVQTDPPLPEGIKKNPLKQQLSEPVLDIEFWNTGNHLAASEPRAPRKLEEIAATKGLWIVSAENMVALNKDREMGLSFLKSLKKPTQPGPKASVNIFRSARGQVSPLRPVKVKESREVTASTSSLGKHAVMGSPDLAPIAEKKSKVLSQAGGMVLNGKKT